MLNISLVAKVAFFGLVLLAMPSCGQSLDEAASENLERTPGTSVSSWQDKALVDAALGKSTAVRINSRTNYITYYEGGKPLAKWKVATGRPGKETPIGIFAVHSKDVCPPWSKDGVSTPGCSPDNPLGKKALWFHESFVYGMHGVNWGAIDSVTASNPRDRDRSSGCVRNHPENIEWLFKKTSVGTPVVVGLWDTDPAVTDCSGSAALCEKAASGGETAPVPTPPPAEPVTPVNPNPLKPETFPAACLVNVSSAGVANLRPSASTAGGAVAQLERQAAITVTEEVQGEAVSGSTSWYVVTVDSDGTQGFLHSSLVDCLKGP
jgi:hypothetical protein